MLGEIAHDIQRPAEMPMAAGDANTRRTYLVLPTAELGGAEKRLLGLFLHLRATGAWPVELICRPELIERAARTEELADVGREPNVVHSFDGNGRTIDRGLVRAVRRRRRADPTALFHFVMVPPQLAGALVPARVVLTIPLSDLSLYNWRGRSMLYVGCALSGKVDFLDVRVRDAVAQRVPWLTNRFEVTPGSFVDLSLFTSAPFAERTKTVVFSGTFIREKGVDRLAQQLREVDARLRALGHARVSYRFMGRDGEQPAISPLLHALSPALDVTVGHEANPHHVLRTARVFLSLQRKNNYPSKSLLEAMAAGCTPVVTDVGSTRTLVDDDLGFFVPREFTAAEMAESCHRALSLEQREFERRERAMRKLLAERFSIEAMAAYYVKLYAALHAGLRAT